MGKLQEDLVEELAGRYPELDFLKESIKAAAKAIIRCYENGGKILVCGNGGSAADSEHIVGELMKGFIKKRPLKEDLRQNLINTGGALGGILAEKLQTALPAISLVSQPALSTAFANDVDPELVFAQQVLGYGKKGDVLIALSTSGNSKNVINAIYTAKALGMVTIGLTGKGGGRMKSVCDILLDVPAEQTHRVQELHLPIYHTLCMLVEGYFFDD
ncbi:D-sedoheptulose-7-phosphate isomerase [Thermosediminibacter litoriperuensis]|uniref:D-sedoheptulose 7-phosphate isomerase n=1 Tax=Thermosediminibacter litoriperuensis TaxID=291989 RepID=A0A5S5AID7_9FIRM|nr:SIS domain-containing protein [Thermosediminibacter litoriperuensis]TYP48726.1 D-sedoheptulose 7-phosphate isomerase [Thermosediminibacter litoriperuensis]